MKKMFAEKCSTVSFEVFPPKRDGNLKNVISTVEKLALLKPDFISVTYGASGAGNNQYTVDIAEQVVKSGVKSLAHLTAVGHEEVDILNVMKRLKSIGVCSILAVRGDKSEGECFTKTERFCHASDLISYIKNHNEFNFEIGGACYPESHLDSESVDEDINNLKIKVDSGLDFLISQLFFENSLFYDYLELVRARRISIPLVAGILPVINAKQIIRILSLCNAKFPKKFARIISKYENKPDALFDAGIAYATEQIIDLLANDVNGVHIYTMNHPEVAARIMKNINYLIK